MAVSQGSRLFKRCRSRIAESVLVVLVLNMARFSAVVLLLKYFPQLHKQVAQLSQSDRAAVWVSFGQRWKIIYCRQYRSTFNHCDAIGLQYYRIR